MSDKSVRRDKYVSTMSDVVSITKETALQSVDLTLPNQKIINIGQSITGTVTDLTGKMLENAYVQLYDKDKNPLRSAITNNEGRYVLRNVEANVVYYVSAMEQKSNLSELMEVVVAERVDKVVNFALSPNKADQLGFIGGTVTSQADKNVIINGGIAWLYKLVGDEKELIAITYSSLSGKYMLRAVELGTYVVRFTALNYSPQEKTVAIDKGGMLLKVDFALLPDVTSNKSTISGMITDEEGKAIATADVVLYKVNNDETLVPVALVQTNQSGVYVFANVPPGDYRVFSNDSVLGEITPYADLPGPDIDIVTVAQGATTAPLVVELTKGNIVAPAKLDTRFSHLVTDIGDKNSGGSVTVEAEAPYNGEYILVFDYISDVDSEFDMSVDTKGFIITTKLPSTGGKIQSHNMIILLEAGKNILKIKGGILPAPAIGTFYIIKKNIEKTINYSRFKEMNPETKYNKQYDSMAMAYPPNSGEAYIVYDIDVNVGADYELTLLYVRAGDTKIKIDVNGEYLGEYTLPQGSGSKNYENTYKVTAKLKLGTNTIKLYQDDRASLLPMVRSINHKQIPYSEWLQAESGVLENGASVFGGYVRNLGGKSRGSVELEYEVPVKGNYDLIVKYVANEETAISVTVNGVKLPNIYFFEPTGQGDTSEPKRKRIPIKLNSTKNTIKFM